MQIKTSLSGFVEDTRRQPLRDVTVKLRGTSYQSKTTAEGLFSFKDLPNLGSLVEVEIDPTGTQQLGSLPFPKLVIKKSFRTGRDNYIERIPLQQESGPSIQVGTPQASTLMPPHKAVSPNRSRPAAWSWMCRPRRLRNFPMARPAGPSR